MDIVYVIVSDHVQAEKGKLKEKICKGYTLPIFGASDHNLGAA